MFMRHRRLISQAKAAEFRQSYFQGIFSGQIDESSTAKYMMLTFSILSKSSGRLSISLLGNLEFLKCSIKASLPCTRPYFTSQTCMKKEYCRELWPATLEVIPSSCLADWVIPCFFAFILLITLLVWHTWVVKKTATCSADSWLSSHGVFSTEASLCLAMKIYFHSTLKLKISLKEASAQLV